MFSPSEISCLQSIPSSTVLLAIWMIRLSLKNGDCDMIELYKYTHANVIGKWSSAVAKKNWEQMNELRDLYAAEDVEKSEQEIVAEVVGRGNGYIKGLGYGPKPRGKQRNLKKQESSWENQKQKWLLTRARSML
ncbi:hypothetical protein CASFOL_004947 [Castilleja foliolosa]|uniref:Uncharacterized protein n=1 Tax=Castilleja foliolosa TaxID=1961234 RepID=A0ABD3EBZ1_9LAMI